jgi:hypothetical protein
MAVKYNGSSSTALLSASFISSSENGLRDRCIRERMQLAFSVLYRVVK